MLFGTRKFMLQNEAGEGGSGGGGAGDDKNKGGSGNPHAEGTGDSGKKDDKGEGQGSGNFDVSTLPKEAQDMIKSLRAENAKHRTDKNALSARMEKIEKGLKGFLGEESDEDKDPEVKLSKIQSEHEALSVRTAILELALEHGIGKEDLEFFEFKMSKKLSSLAEGEELSEDAFAEILGSIKGRAGNGGKAPANSSSGAGKKPDQGGSGDEVTLEQFSKMGMLEKSALYQTKPDLYNKLMADSKNSKLI